VNVAQFLRAVWPATGYFALAIPWVPPGAGTALFVHKVVQSHEEAIQTAEKLKASDDVYFCVQSLIEPRVWNPKKKNRKTGEAGAWEVRTQRNIAAAKCVMMDIDVGADPHKYSTQRDAIVALKNFTTAVGLPAPFIVSSGVGLHVYWPFTVEIPTARWAPIASKLKSLAAELGLMVDPSRTADSASVMRLPGTLHHKGAPRPVTILREGVCTPAADIETKIDEALARCGVAVQMPTRPPAHLDGFADNTNLHNTPPPGIKAVLLACPQMQHAMASAANLPEPLWYAALGLIRHTRNGYENAHKFSAKDPRYVASEVETKLGNLAAQDIGPTTCTKFDSLNPGICGTCPRWGKIKSPIVGAKYTDHAPAPTVPAPGGAHLPPIVIPTAPLPYKRLASGVYVDITVKPKKGDDQEIELSETIKLLDHDFYPIRRYRDPFRMTETHVWCAVLPLVGAMEIHLPAEAMYDIKKLNLLLSNNGVFVSQSAVNMVGHYMVAYIKLLQRNAIAETVYGALGWTENMEDFVLPHKVICADGTTRRPTMDQGSQRTISAVHSAGQMDIQRDLLKFFNHPEYAPNQFAICAALGAPLLYMTGHHGVIINMSGKPGASKSTTLYTGAALWGHPEKMVINGTSQGATAQARENRMMIMSNLPLAVDEITRMPPRAMADMAMGVTQSEGRLRLDTTGTERKTLQGSKSTIMLCTANTSLYSALASDRADSTAESVRVFEMLFAPQQVHTKAQADTYLAELKEHYGHVGEAFITYVVTHRQEVQQRVRGIMQSIDTRMNISGGERFWSAVAAVACAACEIGAELGLLPYDVRTLWAWLSREQIPFMRSAMADQYLSPVSILAEYLESINANMLVLQTSSPAVSMKWQSNMPTIIRQPTSTQLLARHEIDKGLMWVQKKGFKDYCVRLGHNYTTITRTLIDDKIISAKAIQKVLGAGTDYAKGQSSCMLVNMFNTLLSGELAAAEKLRSPDSKVITFPPQGSTSGQ